MKDIVNEITYAEIEKINKDVLASLEEDDRENL